MLFALLLLISESGYKPVKFGNKKCEIADSCGAGEGILDRPEVNKHCLMQQVKVSTIYCLPYLSYFNLIR